MSAIIDSIAYINSMKRMLTSCDQYQEIQRKITSQDVGSLSSEYDAVVLAVGAGIKHLWPMSAKAKLPVSYAGGQNILIPNKHGITKALLKGEYVVPIIHNGQPSLLCGSTKEFLDDFTEDSFPSNLGVAESILRPKVKPLIPWIDDDASVSFSPYSTGIRVIPKRDGVGRLPIVDRFPMTDGSSRKSNVWFITGLASRGLIHHMLLAEWMSKAVVGDDPSHLPKEVRLKENRRSN
jgi:glycine/D-amino acid oxidase-like deaminating enzyme